MGVVNARVGAGEGGWGSFPKLSTNIYLGHLHDCLYESSVCACVHTS